MQQDATGGRLIDYSTLFAAAAVSAFVLSGLILSTCLTLRQGGYLPTVGMGVLCAGVACAALWLYRIGGDSWLGQVVIISLMSAFLLIHRGMSQYVGRTSLGLFEIATLPAMVFCCAVFHFGFDGLAFVLCFLAVAALILDTSVLYWAHRLEVPYLMHGLAGLAAVTASLFALRAYVLASQGQWIIGVAPDNWAENLTALAAVSFVTAVGPLVVALHHVRDRVALISEASTDPLTGLSNRRALMEAFEETAFTPAMAVIMFDLDHFKKTNDIFGHQIGDDVLKRFAYVVDRYAGADAHAYRLGGEEFAVISTRGGEKRAHELACRINVTFGAEVVRTPLGPLRSTVSCGVAAGTDNAVALFDLLALADAALYEAKRTGRNRVAIHSQMAGTDAPAGRRVA